MPNLDNLVDTSLLAVALEQITPEWLGLGNVNNTADNDKYVAYAQSAGAADKVKYALTLRLNGGRTEGSNMWTYDGSTSKAVNITPAKLGAVELDQGTANAGTLLYVDDSGTVTTLTLSALKTLLDSLA